MNKLLFTAILLSLFTSAFALDNGLALTPAMGWNSWNKFACEIDENLIKKTADALVDTGLRDLGYVYLNLDDCWQISRDKQGNIVADPRFPSGMKALGDYIHGKGLRFGVYSDAGSMTCQKRPGSLHYEVQDANSYASWGVDYLKYDNCWNGGLSAHVRYPPMRDALNKTGRRIYYSICEWGEEDPATWAGDVGNSWRTTGDISDEWNWMISIADINERLADYAHPGAWNGMQFTDFDPDMLEVGNGGMTTEEYKTHFSLWALMKAPLIIGCDITNMSPETKAILMNKEVISVNQDPLGRQGRKVKVDGDKEVWAGPLADGSMAVILFNRGGKEQTIAANWGDLGFQASAVHRVRDLWLHKDVGVFTGRFEARIPSHGVVMLRISALT